MNANRDNFFSFRIAHLNLRSIFTGFQEFVDLINDNDFDVVAVTETWLNAEILSDAVSINEYNLVRKDRPIGRGGGIGFYIRKSLQYEVLNIDSAIEIEGFENLWVKVKINNKISLIAGVMYRTKNNVPSCVRALDNILPEILPMCEYVSVLGDLNINLFNVGNPISELFNTFGFEQVINEPTRVTETVSTLLDPIFFSDSEVVQEAGTMCASHISDHKLTYCHIKLSSPKRIQKFVTFRDFKELNEEAFYIDLFQTPWDEIYYMRDVDGKVDFLTDNLTKIFNKHVPFKTVRVNKPPAPWLTPALTAIMRERDRAKIKYKASRSLADLQTYKDLRNFALASVRREKMGYLNFLEQQKNYRMLWKGLRNMNVHSVTKNTIADLPPDLMNPDRINDYFMSIFQKTNNCQNKIDFYSGNSFRAGLQFHFNAVESNVVYKKVYEINSNAAGCDNITLFMLKLSLPAILNHLTHILNCCLEVGHFPDSWKKSIVFPIPKVTNPSEVTELRPISLLPVLSKILEKVVHMQIAHYLRMNELFPVHQSGFRTGHSTTTALFNLTDEVFRALDKNMAVISVSLDYSKAFDMLDHELLCAKLKFLGFDQVSVEFFRSYLSGRRQCVRVGSNYSSAENVVSGVPQGSVVGPLLFIIYTFDIFQVTASSHVQCYADDTQLLFCFDPFQADDAKDLLNQDLHSIYEYSQEHNLKINPNKTEVLLFCAEKRRQILQTEMKLVLGNTNLNFSSCAKNLGIYIDTALRFKEHVKKLFQKS